MRDDSRLDERRRELLKHPARNTPHLPRLREGALAIRKGGSARSSGPAAPEGFWLLTATMLDAGTEPFGRSRSTPRRGSGGIGTPLALRAESIR